ncbi:MAG: glucose-1-phosphate thymidylyltransferase RfbA [Anaerolineae bacterium]|nr:glucose-1-phosphate thymidylyltransferase RfbA [Anaerolineae bacterium]
MKGLILAGGHGTRLHPITGGVCKQLLPVYNKPMIYYPLTILMLAGIREIAVISTTDDLPSFRRLLKDGSQWGLKFQYLEQTQPRGIADAFIVAEEFIGDDPVCLILGDNIFYGTTLPERLRRGAALTDGATVFAYHVQNPQDYAVVTFLPDTLHTGEATDIVEKPEEPPSNFAVPGLYFYDNKVVKYARELKPSPRGELEITDINRIYLEESKLHVEILGRGIAWLDAGTHQSLLQASIFIQAIEERQGMMISSPEEIAFRLGYISRSQLDDLVAGIGNNTYRAQLKAILDESRK